METLKNRESPGLVAIQVGAASLVARLHVEAAPISCAAFVEMLPLTKNLLHVRWSGESTWVPLERDDLQLPYENATRFPHPGQILIYAGEESEPEILMSYGAAAFGSKAGPLAGNHFLTIIEGIDLLPIIGRAALWEGAKTISFDLVT